MEANATSTLHSPALLGNMVAGLSVAGLLVPESIAYASIAGLAPIHALIACLAGLFIYACIGKSIYAVVSPTSSSATIWLLLWPHWVRRCLLHTMLPCCLPYWSY